MELVNESSAEKLLDGGHASADANVFSACGGRGEQGGGVNAASHEMESSLARHRDGGARVVG